MKGINIFVSFLILFLLSIFVSFAIESRYAIHTSGKDIEFKKKKSLNWYEDNVTKKKIYFYDLSKEINLLKDKSLSWYDKNINEGKFYFGNAKKESDFTKTKAINWYERNNQ